MSQTYRNIIARLLAQDQTLGMTEEEKLDVMGWCPISDRVVRDLMKRQGIKGDIDRYLETLSDADIIDIHAKVLKIYRENKKKRKSTIAMLRAEGTAHANAQADKLEEEQRQEDDQIQELEQEQK